MRRLLLSWVVLLFTLPVVTAQTDIDSLLAAMPLRDKVAQMFMSSFYGQPLNEPARDFIATYKPGAVALFPSNLGAPRDVATLTNDIQHTLTENGALPAFIAVDQEGGIIAHLEDGFTRYPVMMLLAATQDNQLAYKVGEAFAYEMSAVGVNMNLAPVADLHTNRDNPIIGRRSFGTFPELVSPIVAAFTEGMQSGGVMATGKHFPGHGDTAQDSHVTLPVVGLSRERLQSVELEPFRRLIAADVGAIMVGHLVIPSLQTDTTLPASLSPEIVTGLLREELGYDGIIMTDALDMDAIDLRFSPAQAAVQAVKAGNDLIAIGAHVSFENQAAAIEAVTDAVANGIIDEAQIDASVRRILQAKATYGVLDYVPVDAETAARRIQEAEHEALIQKMFNSGTTLVYDNSDAIPLNGDDTLVIYPASQPSLWNACSTYGATPLGVTAEPTADEIAWAASLAQRHEHVVVFTQSADASAGQQALVAALPPEKTLVVALWSPYDIEVLPPVSAYLVTYSPLRPSYPAACGILFGDISARGTLAVALDGLP